MTAASYTPQFLWNGPARAKKWLLLAHGAGAGADSAFMEYFATSLGSAGLRVGRFEFPYMDLRRRTGRSGPPDRQPRLIESWKQAIELTGHHPLLIGGKSLGGRIASLVADQAGAAGLVCLGYPFHPPGRPEQVRTAHLEHLQVPTLILQGERDTLGNRRDVESYRLSPSIEIVWLTDGDHSFEPRKKSGVTTEQNCSQAVDAIVRFAQGCEGG